MTNEAKFYKVKSFTEKGKFYYVRKMANGFSGALWRCDCPSFVFQKKRQERNCDHIRKVRHLKLKHHGRRKHEQNR